MKRRTIWLIILVILASLVAIYFVVKPGQSTIKKELKDFAIADTASITKIFMVEKDFDQVTLTREGDHWEVNGKYEVRKDAIDVLLKTLHRIRVKSPVSKAAFENVVRMVATRNTKVEVFQGDKLVKTLYVGGPTQDQMGTYMMLEGSSAPFVVHIPGFIGYLSSRFFTQEDQWRSRILFDGSFDDLAEVQVLNNNQPEESFVIEKDPEGAVTVYQKETGQEAPVEDREALNFYLSRFVQLSCELFLDSLSSPELEDSLMVATPMRTVIVKDQAGETVTIKAHRRYANGKTDDDGNPLVWDDERMYAWVNDKSWAVVQYYVFNDIFLNFSSFLAPVE